MEFLYMEEQEAVSDHIAGDESASCTRAAGTRGRTPHGKAGKRALGPDGRTEEGRRRRRRRGRRETVSLERWMDKNRSADSNEGLEVKRQRGNGVGVVDTKRLQSSFYPSFSSPGSAVDGAAQSRAPLIPLPFHLEILCGRASGSSATETCSCVPLRSGTWIGRVRRSFAES